MEIRIGNVYLSPNGVKWCVDSEPDNAGQICLLEDDCSTMHVRWVKPITIKRRYVLIHNNKNGTLCYLDN